MARGVGALGFIGLIIAAGFAAAQTGTYKIVVNPANPTTSLSKTQVSNLFLRKTVTWESGDPVLPVDQVETSALREAFSRDVLGMSSAAAATSRGDKVFSVASDREVLAYVRLKPGAIGYVTASAPADGVKVLSVGHGGAASAGGSSEPIRVGGTVPAPAKVLNVNPVYPPMARSQRIEGVVELDILISPTGTVEDARPINPPPMLSDAAVAAVKHWRYAPTVINGVAVPVRMTVRVVFSLHT